MSKVKNLEEILDIIEKINKNKPIQLIAVSKNVETNDVLELYTSGQKAFGENRVQELKRKNEILKHLPIQWHFIGNLQQNKINQLIDLNPFLIHSCDSFGLAFAINKRLEVKNKKANILLQINSAKEGAKSGVMPEIAVETYLKIKENCPNLNLLGVMSIGAFVEDKKIIEKSFETTYKIFESLESQGAQICSMGMSNDFELAIKCGSNLIRLGSILFK